MKIAVVTSTMDCNV